MKPPIVINESRVFERSGDLQVYRSVRRAEHACEPWAADHPDINAFDSEGRLLKMLPKQRESRIILEPATDTPQHLDVLRGILRDFLIRTGTPVVEANGMSVEVMLSLIYARDPDPGGWDPDAPRKPGLLSSLIDRLKALFAA